MDLQAGVAGLVKSARTWQVAQEPEINFNGRGKVSLGQAASERPARCRSQALLALHPWHRI